jgi:hypothetical protein
MKRDSVSLAAHVFDEQLASVRLAVYNNVVLGGDDVWLWLDMTH